MLDGLLPADGGRDGGTDGAEVEAEVLHALCGADGVLELLDWSRQGVGADPLACLWLGSLRWYRLITGGFPAEAPAPPPRELDSRLTAALRHGELRLTPGDGAVSLAGLASGQMAYPSSPAQAESESSDALVRVLPLALVPYAEPAMLRSWADQSVCLTQGGDEVRRRAAAVVDDLGLLGGSAAPSPRTDDAVRRLSALADELAPGVGAVLRRVVERLATAVEGSVPEVRDLHPCLHRFAAEWEAVTGDGR